MRRSIRMLILLACASLAATTASAQQPYPTHPVRIVVAFPAGGATDVITRAVGQRLSEMWGQAVVIENKGGAGTQIGTELVSKATADGYTLLATSDAFAFNPSLYRKLSYDPNDLVPISGLGIVNQVLVTSPAVPFKTVAELIAQAKAKPLQVNYGTMGVGTSGHINMTMFERMAGVELTPVHYRGGAPLVTDLLGGHVQTGFVSLTLVAEHVKAGRLRALGVGSPERSPRLPDVPSIAEAGLPGYDAVTWFGLFAPRGTPAGVIAKVNADVQRVLADTAFQEKSLNPAFFEPIKGSAQEFGAFVDHETSRWGPLIKDAKMTVE